MSKKGEDDDDDSMEENKKKREEKIKLQETIYEGLGKAWPACKETQGIYHSYPFFRFSNKIKYSYVNQNLFLDQYCLQFITHCFETLPMSTRPVQVSILTTLNRYVDKLVLLKTDFNKLSEKDKEALDSICGTLLKILRYAIGISFFW